MRGFRKKLFIFSLILPIYALALSFVLAATNSSLGSDIVINYIPPNVSNGSSLNKLLKQRPTETDDKTTISITFDYYTNNNREDGYVIDGVNVIENTKPIQLDWKDNPNNPDAPQLNDVQMYRVEHNGKVDVYALSEKDIVAKGDMSYLFTHFLNLKSIYLKNFKTDEMTRMDFFFAYNDTLTDIYYGPDFDTSKVTSMRYLFYDDTAFETIDLSRYNTSQVTNMSYFFSNCSNLKNIIYGDEFTTANVTTMDGVFSYSALETIDLSRYNTSQVISMAALFNACSNLKNIVYGDEFSTANVKNMDWMFSSAAIDTLDLSNWNTSQVTNMSNFCRSCPNLQSVILGDIFDTRKVISCRFMFSGCKSLKNVEFGQNCTFESATDMAAMFFGSDKLESLDLSGFNTQNVTLMSQMFENCSMLQSIDLTNFNTSQVTGMQNMFKDCPALTEIKGLESFNTSQVKNFGSMFIRCKSLTDISEVKNFNTEQATDMSDMFYGCSLLTELDVSGYVTPNVTTLSGMFYNCSGLTSLNLSNFNTSKVTRCDGMFNNCSSLESITFGQNCTFDATENMSSMFNNCSSLQTIDVSNFNTQNATTMQSMFGNCSSLTEINGLGNFNTSQVKNMRSMFDRCSLLTSIDVSSFHTENVENMYAIFYNCSSLTEINGLGNFNTSQVKNMSCMFAGCSSLTELDLTNFNTSNATTFEAMFWNCTKLQTIKGIEDFNTSNVTIMGGTGPANSTRGMFENCNALKSLDLSKWDTSKVTAFGWMFANCKALTELDLRNFSTESCVSIADQWWFRLGGGMFYGCSALETIKFGPKFTCEKIEYFGGLFNSCTNLTTIEGLQYFNLKNATNLECFFFNCSSLTEIVGIANWDIQNVTQIGGMFAKCENLNSLNLSNWNTKNVQGFYEGSWARVGMFQGCTNLTEIIFGENFTTSNATTMHGMFNGCSNLISLDLSGFDTHNVTDMNGMFNGCSHLTELDLSNFDTHNVTDMSWMFHTCYALTEIIGLEHFNTSNVTTMNRMFLGMPIESLDLSNFDTSKVNDCSFMFYICTNLQNIYVGENWSMENATVHNNMFTSCSKLPHWEENGRVTDKTYAYAGQNQETGKWGYLTHISEKEI